MAVASETPGAPRLLTADDLWLFPDDGRRHELVDGEVRSMPPAGFEHGYVEVNLASELSRFVRAHGLGWVVGGDTGFILGRDPNVVLAPDVAFVATERLPASDARQIFAELAPDLVVEVVSP